MIFKDLRHALRIMRKDPLVTIIATLILALGIGSTTTVFSLANGLLIRPLPYAHSDRIVAVQEINPRNAGFTCCEVAFPNYLDIRARARLLDDVALYADRLATIRGDGNAERIPAANVSDGLFHILGVAPILGRTFSREEDLPNGANIVVIGEDLWKRRYGAEPDIVGKVLDIGGAKNRVIGVMPTGFRFPQVALAWFPLQLSANQANRTDHFFDGIARLKPGVSIEQSNAELRSIMEQINRENPVTSYGNMARAVPIRQVLAGSYRSEVVTLLGAVGFLLLIACANITNLMLVKATGRSREMAVRAALGASRVRLVRQLITESLLLGAMGGMVGLVLTYAGLPGLLRLIPIDLPAWMHFAVDLRVLTFVIGVSLLSSIIFGVAHAFGSSRVDTSVALRNFAPSLDSSPSQKILRNALIIGEVALSFFLLIGAGLLMRSFAALRNQPLGFDTTHTLTMYLAVPPDRYPAGPKFRTLLQQIQSNFSSLPSVSSVAFASGIPFETTSIRSLTVEGFPVLAAKDTPIVNHTVVTPDYFRSLSIPILTGRDFSNADYDNPLVAIVDENLSKNYWPQEAAIGRRIHIGTGENGPWHTIVGVVHPVLNQSLTISPKCNVYTPFSQRSGAGVSVVIRSAADPAQLISAVRSRMSLIDRDIALSAVYTLEQVVDRASWQQRFFAVLFVVFASLATALVAVGLYGVLAYTVSMRAGEISIRMALGASTARVQMMILKQGLALVLSGLVIGLAIAIALVRVLANQLYHVSPTDPITYAAVAVLFCLVSLIACWIPARQAMRVNPIVALRHE